jgi:hypothetical protein
MNEAWAGVDAGKEFLWAQPRENPLGERSRWVMTKRLLRTTLE